jgi:hypothetical protein
MSASCSDLLDRAYANRHGLPFGLYDRLGVNLVLKDQVRAEVTGDRRIGDSETEAPKVHGQPTFELDSSHCIDGKQVSTAEEPLVLAIRLLLQLQGLSLVRSGTLSLVVGHNGDPVKVVVEAVAASHAKGPTLNFRAHRHDVTVTEVDETGRGVS